MHIIPTTKVFRWGGNRRWKHGGSRRYNGSNQSLLRGELSDGRWQGDRSLADVPKGFLPIYVGPESRRFIIPADYLSMPDFVILMQRAEEEFGFDQEGGLKIPCEEPDFEQVLFKCMERQKIMAKNRKN